MENKHIKPRKILLKITPAVLYEYDKRSVFFTNPKLLACYERNYGNITPANKIRYLKVPKLTQYPFDLNDGYDTYRTRLPDVFSNTIDMTLKYIMSPASEGGAVNDEKVDSVERTMIYTRRGTLATIMKSNYVNSHNNWTIKVSRYNGNIYMLEVNDEPFRSLKHLKKPQTHHARLVKLLFAESPSELPNLNEPFDENITLNCIHRSSLGKYDIVYSGEVQGILAEEKFEDFNDLEALNQCRFVLGKQVFNTRKTDDITILKYWLQAYLGNVKDMYVAYKNSVGIVEEPIEHQIVSNLPKNRSWKPKICTAFLHDFLEHIEKLMSHVNCLNTVYEFHFISKYKIINYEIYEDSAEKTFLTKEYIDYCKNKIN